MTFSLALKSGFLHSARHQAVVVALALDTNVHAFLASAILGFLLTPFALVESPTYRSTLVIKLAKTFELIRAIGTSFGRSARFLSRLYRSWR